jgi:hypothetical protein
MNAFRFSRSASATLLAAMFGLTGLCWGQEARASLGGRVFDPQGAVVPKAKIEVTSDDTGVKQNTTTNSDGNWSVRFLVPGRYSFTVSAAGFKETAYPPIELQTADNKVIDVQLALGAASDRVTVSSQTPLIDTTSSASGTVIDQTHMLEVPTNSRVATLFAVLSPGVIQQDQNNNVYQLWSQNAASQFVVNGGTDNSRSTEFEMDGMPNMEFGGKVNFIAPPDFIQETRVVMNSYDASIGRQAGGTLQQSTKSGTSTYHGMLYELNQNSHFNANAFQANISAAPVPPVHYNEYGGNFSGPVWIPKLYNGKRKTFFFVGYDGFRKLPQGTGIQSVPTALERQGDFSQSFTTQQVNGKTVQYPIQVYDPASIDSNGNRTLFPGNVIPQNRLSPIAQNILKYVPLPNTPSQPTGNAVQNLVGTSHPAVQYLGMELVRVDQTWSNNQKTFVNVHSAFGSIAGGPGLFDQEVFATTENRSPRGVGLDHVWTVSATKVLDVRFAVSRIEDTNEQVDYSFDPTQLGFPQRFESLMVRPEYPCISGLFGNLVGCQSISNNYSTYYTWIANFTHIVDNHTFNYGGEYWVLQQGVRGIGQVSEFDFSTNWTTNNPVTGGGTGIGSPLASFLLGLPTGGNMPTNATALYSQRYAGLHVGDDWRVTGRLTINVGLRWDFERPPEDRYNRLTSDFDPTVLNPISGAAQAAYAQILANSPSNAGVQVVAPLLPASSFRVMGAQLFAGVNGQPRTVYNADWKEFQPRVGFAYRLGANTVVRGGFGRFVQPTYDVGGQNGFSVTTPLTATTNNYLGSPYDTLANPFQNGLIAPTGSSLGPLTNLGQSVNWYNQNPGRPYSWEYSLHLQHQLKSWLFEVGYTHNKTYALPENLNENLPSWSLQSQLLAPQFSSTGAPVATLPWNQLVPNPFYQLPGVTGSIATSSTVAASQLLSPIPLLGAVTESINPWGSNQYDALVSKVERRFRGGFGILAAFTWSRQFQNTQFLGPQQLGVVAHALGNEDRPLHLSVAPVWEIPIGRGRKVGPDMPKVLNAFIGGWELSGVFTIQSGLPVLFNTSAFFSGQDFALPNSKQSLNEWFDTSQWAAFPSKNTNIANYPAWTGIQNLPGYSYVPTSACGCSNGVYQDFGAFVHTAPYSFTDVRASRVNDVDGGIYKNFNFLERFRLQYRFEVYNAFNHPRFAAPDTNPSDPTFGQVARSQVNPARVVQMLLKLYF